MNKQLNYVISQADEKSPAYFDPYHFEEELLTIFSKKKKEFLLNNFVVTMDNLKYMKSSGRGFMDIHYGGGSGYLVSNKFVKLVNENNLTGCIFNPVTIVNKKGELLSEDYSRLSFQECLGVLYPNLNKIIKQDLWNLTFDGCYIEYEGELPDFFISEGSFYTFVSQKVKDIVEANKLKNFAFVLLEEFQLEWRRPMYNVAMGYDIHKGL
jgi:hypothetical protein